MLAVIAAEAWLEQSGEMGLESPLGNGGLGSDGLRNVEHRHGATVVKYITVARPLSLEETDMSVTSRHPPNEVVRRLINQRSHMRNCALRGVGSQSTRDLNLSTSVVYRAFTQSADCAEHGDYLRYVSEVAATNPHHSEQPVARIVDPDTGDEVVATPADIAALALPREPPVQLAAMRLVPLAEWRKMTEDEREGHTATDTEQQHGPLFVTHRPSSTVAAAGGERILVLASEAKNDHLAIRNDANTKCQSAADRLKFLAGKPQRTNPKETELDLAEQAILERIVELGNMPKEDKAAHKEELSTLREKIRELWTERKKLREEQDDAVGGGAAGEDGDLVTIARTMSVNLGMMEKSMSAKLAQCEKALTKKDREIMVLGNSIKKHTLQLEDLKSQLDGPDTPPSADMMLLTKKLTDLEDQLLAADNKRTTIVGDVESMTHDIAITNANLGLLEEKVEALEKGGVSSDQLIGGAVGDIKVELESLKESNETLAEEIKEVLRREMDMTATIYDLEKKLQNDDSIPNHHPARDDSITSEHAISRRVVDEMKAPHGGAFALTAVMHMYYQGGNWHVEAKWPIKASAFLRDMCEKRLPTFPWREHCDKRTRIVRDWPEVMEELYPGSETAIRASQQWWNSKVCKQLTECLGGTEDCLVDKWALSSSAGRLRVQGMPSTGSAQTVARRPAHLHLESTEGVMSSDHNIVTCSHRDGVWYVRQQE